MIATLTNGTQLQNVRGFELMSTLDRHPHVHKPAVEQKVRLIQTNEFGLAVPISSIESITSIINEEEETDA